MKLTKIAQCIALMGVAGCAIAQTTTTELKRVEVTGSSIKRIASEGSLPVQVITTQELQRQGITTAEQVIASLSVNGNGLDNLASNADVVSGAARGNNGSSSANLRGQGAASTLVLLNGRRVAAHGLNGGVVDLNSIPMAALDRIEILKDGASAIYGTDAIGGVINFILKKNYTGFEASAFTDITQQGGGRIDKMSLTGGTGDLEKDGYNVLFSLGRNQSQVLRGSERNFVNTFQASKGLSVDTRGTPYATVFNLAGSALPAAVALPSGGQTYTGINTLNKLMGGPGCDTIDGMADYDAVLWATPSAKYGCAWDTGRAAVLQQPVTNTNLVARGTLQLGEHQVYAELTAAKVDSAKSFSANQISSSTSATSVFRNLMYPSTGSAYNSVFNSLVATFPSLEANRGKGLAFRWRCLPCGDREIVTTSTTTRYLIGAEGPLGGGWDYRAGISSATSDTTSVLGNGYFYGKEFAALLNTGVLNPFAADQKQTPEALTALAGVSANGVTLYGGKYTLVQTDATTSGPVFKLPAGDVMAAVGVDLRTEKYSFNGNATDVATQARVFNAPFDSINTMDVVQRDIKALYGELLVPLAKNLEATVALRRDDYTGFGSTTNPKYSIRFTPVEEFLVRGSYSTGFRVPTFNQLFFGMTTSPYSGKDLVDPAKCAGGKVDLTKVGCESITPDIITGGKSDLGPESSKQWTAGFVWAPSSSFSVGMDNWNIRKTGTIQALSLTDLVTNYTLFPQNFIRDAAGNLTQIDQRWVNAGETITSGVDINASANGKLADGKWSVDLEGTYLYEKISRLISSKPFGDSEIGVFSRAGDLGLRWKHSLKGTYSTGDWSTSLTQVYRAGYKDAMLPGVANGSIVPPDWNADVAAYVIYNASVTYTGIKNLTLVGGIKNLLNTDPPFSAAYDGNTGAGSSWEPRVADPRGRSLTLQANYKF